MNRKKQSWHDVWEKNKIILTSVATITPLFFLTGFVHEIGHIVVCVSNGFDYQFYFGQLAMNVQCSDTPQPVLLYFASGGIFGLVSSLMLFLSKRIRKNTGVFIGVAVIAFDHFLKAIFETFFHSDYLSNPNLFMFLSIMLVVFWISLYWFFHQRSKKIA